MDFRWLLKLVLAVFVTVGLAVAPLVAPAVAQAPSSAAEMAGMASTAADMPCCPEQQKSKGCADCLIVSMCVSSMQAVPAMTAAIPIRHSVRAPLFAFDDVTADGLVRPPPDHPPRNLT